MKRGRIADGGHHAQRFHTYGLKLMIAAVVHWNPTYLADAVQHVPYHRKTVPDLLLGHMSPPSLEQNAFSGCFL